MNIDNILLSFTSHCFIFTSNSGVSRFFHSSAFTVGTANTHRVQKRGPTCQGIVAPRQYQHTLIAVRSTAHYLVCGCAWFESEIWILYVLVAPYFGCLCVCVCLVAFCFCLSPWTLETADARFSPSLHLEMMWMRLFHDGKGCPALKQRESISFWWFLAHQDDFAHLSTTKTIFKAEKAPSY